MSKEAKVLECPHCRFLIPVTGQGGRIVAKVQRVVATPKPSPPKDAPFKPGLHDILGEHYDPYWAVAGMFGKTKNFAPIASATAYMEHIKAGATDERIFKTAEVYARLTEPQYLKQFVNWLNNQDFTVNLPEGDSHAADRFATRRHAE